MTEEDTREGKIMEILMELLADQNGCQYTYKEITPKEETAG